MKFVPEMFGINEKGQVSHPNISLADSESITPGRAGRRHGLPGTAGGDTVPVGLALQARTWHRQSNKSAVQIMNIDHY